jgi:hypothetical protein
MAEKTRGDKFPLLIYRRWAKMLRLPSLLIVVASGIAWWFAPEIPLFSQHEWVPVVIAGISALIFCYSLLAHRMAYVQCFPNYIKIRVPFLSIAVSYKRIVQMRPVQFRSQLRVADMKRPRLRMLEPYLGHTAIVLELNDFPLGERQLRLWLPWYVFASDTTGFVLVVNDWMALSRQISSFNDRWITRRQTLRHRVIGRTY